MRHRSLGTSSIVINLSRTIGSNQVIVDVLNVNSSTIPSKSSLHITIRRSSQSYRNNLNSDTINLELIEAQLQLRKHRRLSNQLTNIPHNDRIFCVQCSDVKSTLRVRLDNKTANVALLHCACILPSESSPAPSETEGHGVRAAVTTAAGVTCHLRRSGKCNILLHCYTVAGNTRATVSV